MSETTSHGWTILDRARGVWIHEYAFTREGLANCVAVRMPEGKVLVLSPACGLPEGAFQDLDELGPVGAIVATNGFHHLGLPPWRKRFPDARCFAPTNAAARIAKKNPDAGPLESFDALASLLGDDVVVRDAPNSKCGEMWAMVKGSEGYLWFVSDILANLPALPSGLVPRLLFKWTKSAPGYRVFNLALQFMVKDKRAVLRALLDDLAKYPPHVVIPAHGAPLTGPETATQTRTVLQAAL